MIYSNEEWGKCRWRVDTVAEDIRCYDVYPELADIFKPIVTAYQGISVEGNLSMDSIVRYIVLTYHRFSPFAVNEQNIIKRKIQVCEFIGLNPS